MFIRLIGMFEVRDEAGVDRTPRGAKARGLLALLVRTPGHRRPRRWLESRLWSDRGPEQASGSLRQALSELRRALGPLADRLRSDRDMVALGAFRTDAGDPASVREALAQGREFLEGIDILDAAFAAWLTEERQKLAAEAAAAAPVARPIAPFSLQLADLPEGTSAVIAQDLAAAIARLTAEHLLVPGQRGVTADRLPGGVNLVIEGDWTDDTACLKVRLVDQAMRKTLWSQRLVASLADSRGELPRVTFDSLDAKLM